LGWVVFYQKRPFTRAQFRRFMFAQSKPYCRDDRTGRTAQAPVRIEDRRGQQRIARSERVPDSQIQAGRICGLFHFLLLRPHPQARRRYLSGSRWTSPRRQPRQVLYIENTPMFVQIAEGLGIRSILHTDYKSTCAKLASFGLNMKRIQETIELDERLLARRQLSVGRADLSLRQSAAARAAEAVAREAAGGRALGHDAGPELHLRAFEPGHQEV
jgi:hypothetical protein